MTASRKNTPKGRSKNAKKPLAKDIKTRSLFIRAPAYYYHDIQDIVKMTGLSMNAVCLELLRPAIKAKLKELKE
jgi:hypothetical protein